tara:strand:- start:2090 stop:3394 length:1305 start_codon:yes stop_codon:yes gene_type:complete
MYINSSQKQNVLIYVEDFEHYSIDKKWNDQKYNVGFGGTTFQQLRLISELQGTYKNFLQIVALIDKSSDYIFPNGVETCSIENLKRNSNNENTVLIINSGGCLRHFELFKKLRFKKILVWLHHPFDKKKCALARELNAEAISCGLFQYFSNSIYFGRHSYVNNFFYEQDVVMASREKCLDKNILKECENQINIGYLGNIRRSKGFHILAEYWNEISLSLRKLGYVPKLIVIGGMLNSTEKKISAQLGIEEDYEKQLLKLFKNDMKIPENVYFTSVVKNPYKYLNHIDLCVVNPLGKGEAASQTVLELYALSIPVVTSEKFGMFDFSDHIGELAISNKSQFTEKVISWFKMNELEKKDVIKKQTLISHFYSQTISLTLGKWLALILDDSKESISFSPIPRFKALIFIIRVFFTNKLFFIKRITKKIKKSIKKITS